MDTEVNLSSADEEMTDKEPLQGGTMHYNGNHVTARCTCSAGMVQCRGQVTRVRVENPNLRILATLLYALCSMCCNICFGLAAFAAALSATGDADKGEYEEAKMKSRKACVLATVAILIGVPMFCAAAVFAGREASNALTLVNDANDLFDLIKRTRVLDMFDKFLQHNNS